MFGVYGKTIDYKDGYYGIGILSRYIYRYEENFLPWPNKAHERETLLEGLFEIGEYDLFCIDTFGLSVAKDERSTDPFLLPSISMIIDTLWFRRRFLIQLLRQRKLSIICWKIGFWQPITVLRSRLEPQEKDRLYFRQT